MLAVTSVLRLGSLLPQRWVLALVLASLQRSASAVGMLASELAAEMLLWGMAMAGSASRLVVAGLGYLLLWGMAMAALASRLAAVMSAWVTDSQSALAAVMSASATDSQSALRAVMSAWVTDSQSALTWHPSLVSGLRAQV
jgi:hypothetical protein